MISKKRFIKKSTYSNFDYHNPSSYIITVCSFDIKENHLTTA